MAGKVIGIDLGTTNSCVALMENGQAKVIHNAEGGRTTPSVVAFKSGGEIIVGEPAKRQATTNPQKTVFSVKRLIGRSFSEISEELKIIPYEVSKGKSQNVVIKIGDKKYTPQEISSMVLKEMKKIAEDYLGEEVKDAVVTVPAYFNDSQRQATKDAGKIAGLNVLRIINEPTAAALAFGADKKKDMKVAVYDLGGGTFDISILEISDGVFEVKSTNGDTHLGGDNFDMILINHIADQFKKEQGIDLRSDPIVLQRLKDAAEKAKIDLSSKLETEVNLPFITADANGPKHLQMNISRAKYENLVSDLVEKSIEPCKKAVKDSKLKVSEIDEILLVGGMTRMPLVQKKVEEFFKKKPNKGINPDEAVAVGAAIQGGILSGDKSVGDILLVDVTPLSLGIETLGGVSTKLIDRNTPIPVKKSEIFTTAADNQPEVDIHVLQGERPMAANNKTIGRFQLAGIPPMPRSVPQIEVTFDIDANGILHVTAKDKGTGKEQTIKIQVSSGLSDDDIEMMVNEAKENEEEDKKRKEIIEARNKAENLVFQTEKIVKEMKENKKISEDEEKEIGEKIETLKEKAKGDSKEDIEKAIDELSQYFAGIYQKYAADQQSQQQGSQEGDEEAPQEPAAEGDEVIDADFDEK
ncbi:molecular chaperone DnaK [bacterium]|nr:molecular chaperone DnaK [bacterium]